MKIYIRSDEELESMYTKQLIKLLKSIRIKERMLFHSISGCCVMCGINLGEDWNSDVDSHFKECDTYAKRIKAILAKRPHIPTKKEAKEIRRNRAKYGKSN